MAGIISFRTTKAERDQLKAWTAQRGYKYVSELIRATFGFEIGLPGTETLQEVDQLDNFETMARAVAALTDRQDEMYRMVKRIASALGANRAGELPPGLATSGPKVEITGAKTPVQHPKPPTTMPEGFDR